jgi:hypothetical protein
MWRNEAQDTTQNEFTEQGNEVVCDVYICETH